MNSTEARTIFRYQTRFLYLEIPIISLILAVLILSWLPYVVSLVSFDLIVKSAMRATLYLNITVFALFIFFRLIKRELQKVEIIITDDRMTKKTPYNISVIRFADITSLRYVHIPLVKGFLEIGSRKSKLRLSLFIEDLNELTARLHKGIGNRANPVSIDENTLRFINETSTVYDYAYRRSAVAYYPLIGFSLLSIIVNVFVAGGLWNLSLIPLLLWTMCGVSFPICAFALSDWRINFRLCKNFYSETASLAQLYKVEYLLGALMVFFMYLVFGIFFRTLFWG